MVAGATDRGAGRTAGRSPVRGLVGGPADGAAGGEPRRQLGGLDSAFLALESSTTHLHVAGLLVLDPGSAGTGFDEVREVVAARLVPVPPFRQRLVPVPLGLQHPWLADDEGFDLDRHVLRAELPPPGGDEALRTLVGELVSRPLARDRPLWELHVVEGLGGGRLALVAKLHHAIVDGVAGAEVLAMLFDPGPGDGQCPGGRPDRGGEAGAGGEPGGRGVGPPDGAAEPVDHLGRVLAALPRQADAVAGAVLATVRGIRALGDRSWSAPAGTPTGDGAHPVPSQPLPFTAPRTSINRAISAHRQVAFTQLPLGDVERVRRAFGGTVNDVVLAVVSGALRRFFHTRGEEVAGPLVAMVPISVRGDGEGAVLGNRVSGTLVSLASDVDDPPARFRAIVEATSVAKDRHRAVGPDLLAYWAEALLPAVTSPVATAVAGLRVFDHLPPLCNVVVSTVPASPTTLSLAGARLVRAHPLGPVVEGVGLNVTALSYEDHLDVGLLACSRLVPDVDVVAAGMGEALDELAPGY